MATRPRSWVQEYLDLRRSLAAARAEAERLRGALRECAQRVGDDGQPCWCALDYMVPYRGHDAGCEAARAAFAASAPDPADTGTERTKAAEVCEADDEIDADSCEKKCE